MIALPFVALVGLCVGAWSAVRSEAKRTAALRDEILQAVERAEARPASTYVFDLGGDLPDLDGAELSRRVRAFKIRTGRAVD